MSLAGAGTPRPAGGPRPHMWTPFSMPLTSCHGTALCERDLSPRPWCAHPGVPQSRTTGASCCGRRSCTLAICWGWASTSSSCTRTPALEARGRRGHPGCPPALGPPRRGPGWAFSCRLCGRGLQERGEALAAYLDGREPVLRFRPREEEALLGEIVRAAAAGAGDLPPLGPATLLALCVQHSARELELGHLPRLLGRLARLIKEAVWVSAARHRRRPRFFPQPRLLSTFQLCGRVETTPSRMFVCGGVFGAITQGGSRGYWELWIHPRC